MLAAVMFPSCSNDAVKDVSSYAGLFADDTKIIKCLGTEEDCKALQQDLRMEPRTETCIKNKKKKDKMLKMGKVSKVYR